MGTSVTCQLQLQCLTSFSMKRSTWRKNGEILTFLKSRWQYLVSAGLLPYFLCAWTISKYSFIKKRIYIRRKSLRSLGKRRKERRTTGRRKREVAHLGKFLTVIGNKHPCRQWESIWKGGLDVRPGFCFHFCLWATMWTEAQTSPLWSLVFFIF